MPFLLRVNNSQIKRRPTRVTTAMIKSFTRNTNSCASGCALTSSSEQLEELNQSCSKWNPKCLQEKSFPKQPALPLADMDCRPWLLSLLGTLDVLFTVQYPTFPNPKEELWQSVQWEASVPAGLEGLTGVSRQAFAEDPTNLHTHKPPVLYVHTHTQLLPVHTHTHTQLWHCLSVLKPGPPMGSFPAQAIPHPSFGADQPVRQYGAAHTRHHRCLVYRWQRKYEFWVIALF